MSSSVLKTGQVIACIAISMSLTACGGETQSKTGALPAIVSVPSTPPTSAEARRAYEKGFKQRYDIPVLTYPPEIQARLQAARLEKLRKSEKLLNLNMAIVKKTLTSDYVGKLRGHDKAMATELLSHLDKGELDKLLDSDRMMKTMSDVAIMSKNFSPKKPPLTEADYDKAVKAYGKLLKSYTIEDCRWTEMKKLIGSGYEDMAFIHGHRPSHGYRCITEITIRHEFSSKYDRPYDSKGFFIQSTSGEWEYYGKYSAVGVRPRRLKLNPLILENPEKAVDKLTFWSLGL